MKISSGIGSRFAVRVRCKLSIFKLLTLAHCIPLKESNIEKPLIPLKFPRNDISTSIEQLRLYWIPKISAADTPLVAGGSELR